jgi:uncharacterized protein
MAEPWFKDGLHFTCTQCGKCCGGKPGYVWVNDEEIAAIAAFLGEPAEVVFGVYEARPRQCRTWPFWETTTKTEQAWALTAEGCPGCNQGELIPSEEILKRISVIRI